MFKCGIIGLPNVGKSTLFNVLTSSSVKSENFPFCTIQANKGFIPILDIRLYQLSRLMQVDHIIYGNIELIDIAGLIKGASKGEGLGNKFLNDIAEVDILLHVVRCFEEDNIYHVNSEIHPIRDIEIINDELMLSDIFLCESLILSIEKNIQHKNTIYTNYTNTVLKLLKKVLGYLYNRNMLYNAFFTVEEKVILKNYNFLTFKSIIYIANINSDDRSYLFDLFISSINGNTPYISICALLEEKITKLKIDNMISNIDYFNKFIKNNKFFDIINIIYQVLQLKTFFTINTTSIRAWITSKDVIAVEAANMIHSDFKKYFIRVQIVKYSDFISCQGWKQSKNFGKMKIEGKNYLIKDGDILHFLI